MIRTLIVDDHPLVRAGFRRIIEAEIDIGVAGECGNAAEVLRFLREQECDVVVLDIDLPGKSGLELLVDLQILAPDAKVLVQSIHPEERYAVRMLKAGASGYITKEAAADELVKAIRQIHHGGKYVSPKLAQMLAFDLEKTEKPPHEHLSDREFQILRLIGSGKEVGEIAEILSLSVNTVNTYRKRLLEKMKMKSNAELMYYAIKHDLAA